MTPSRPEDARDLAERGLARLSAFLAARTIRDDARGHMGLSADRGSIVVLPFRIGPHALAIESTRVVEVRPGTVVPGAADPARPIAPVDLHGLLREPSSSAVETVIARADGSIGRSPGPRVAFTVDSTKPLRRVPLEQLQPFPRILEPKLEVDVLVAVLDLGDQGILFLLDPGRLARAGAGVNEPKASSPRAGGD